MPIPRIIIQTWKTSDLPQYYKHTQHMLMQNNPDYEYKFFDDEMIVEFINNKYRQFGVTASRFKKKIQLIDFFRMLVIYEYGGFYFDMDVEVTKNLDPLLVHECVFPVEMLRSSTILKEMGYDYNIGNYAFGASKKNPVIWHIIMSIVKVMEDPSYVSPHLVVIADNVEPDNFDKTDNSDKKIDNKNREAEVVMQEYVYHTTGPVMVSKAVYECLARESDDAAMNIKLLYPEKWPSYSSWFLFGDYAKHTMTGTWKADGWIDENSNIEKGFAILTYIFVLCVVLALITYVLRLYKKS